MEFNKYQTTINDLNLDKYPEEVVEQFYNFIDNIPFIKNSIATTRLYAKDLPRDNEGRIIVDITKPHILEDMDYFRPSAIHFQKHGCYTMLRPNPNPNSEYGKWVREEIKRCWYGYVRESDGEWIPGDYYYYLNYCPIQLIKKLPNGQSVRTVDFPRVWDGQYLVQHYLYRARANGHHASELASRGKGKSFMGAGLLAKRFKLGESESVNRKVLSAVTASDRKYIWGPNQILNMFKYYIDFQSQHTQFPRQMLTDSAQALMWESGYKDKETGVRMGTQNSVVGVTTGVNQDKLNGSRGVLYLVEEAGIFNNLNSLYQMIRPSVEDGKDVYGLIFMYGTAGDDMSDFTSLQEIMYNPDGYNMERNDNVWDIEGQGRKFFTFFYPAYLNRANCMDEDGNSNITKAILEICQDRFITKYNSTDINAITKRISQYPVTPQEAILRTRGTKFPVTQLNEQLNQLDSNPNSYDDVYIGDLVLGNSGEVSFRPSSNTPIRDFPLKDNTARGALEIFAMPEKSSEGKISSTRYIAGFDPYDNDQAESSSLGSVFVLDLFTDKIVAEYTGRTNYADELYEQVRLLCMFYNCKCLYESNKKGTFAYFSRMNSTHLLADTPEYLRDKQLVKYNSFGSNAKGVNASNAINNYADELIKDWLLKEVTINVQEEDEDKIVTTYNLYFIKNRALLRELVLYNPDINVDRVRALGMLMLYREEKMILYQGDMSRTRESSSASYLGNDPYFNNNFTSVNLGKISIDY